MPSPSSLTETGRKILAEDPDNPGSLGIAISEAIEMAVKDPQTKYALGSVLNHVLLHQTVIGLEAKEQMEMVDAYPDVVIGCFGGGSNFAGISFPFVRDKIMEGKQTRIIAVEPQSCPKLTRGQFRYDFGDTIGMTPLIPMFTLGHNFMPPAIHAGGLRYHGAGAIVSQLLKDGLIEPSGASTGKLRSRHPVCPNRRHYPRTGIHPCRGADRPRGLKSQGRRARKSPSCLTFPVTVISIWVPI